MLGANCATLLGVGGRGFDPLTLSPYAWYDFSDASTLFTDAGVTKVSADGAAIYRAGDKSGNARHLEQPTLAMRPAYKTAIKNGLSVGRADAVDDVLYMVANTFPQNTFTCVIVLSKSSVASLTLPFSFSSGGGGTARLYMGGESATAIYARAGRDGNDSGDIETATVTSGNYYLHRVRGLSGTLYSSINAGAEESGAFVNALSINNYFSLFGFAGGLGPSFGAWFGGDICECLIIPNGSIDSSVMADLMGYLNDKWSIY